ncbi:hypothetical protein AJ78_06215 [Emergomyces pasteurianus Ep9510]|uniref:Cyclin n=1 Tax=Emergomyces pasteurianus Ep9510 TaxID=1447872 RepID=A0A1J9QBP8_9EURO|nr:hypothetical protein AJ78_06215 [Emergomyces pasteurianus Ep9510]
MNRPNEELEADVRVDLTSPVGQLSLSPKRSTQPADSSSVPVDISSYYDEVFSLPPESALMALCAHVTKLAKLTGDVPSSTPIGETILLHQRTDKNQANRPTGDNLLLSASPKTGTKHPETVSPIILIKGFYCKKISPISLEDYLLRVHRYCPMSTAVYLATSRYIRHLAIVEKIIYVTPRNMHRLVLGGLRVATKMMEDLCYTHRRFAKVGGVTERELAKLEINFSFLMDFELMVDVEMMFREIVSYREGWQF